MYTVLYYILKCVFDLVMSTVAFCLTAGIVSDCLFGKISSDFDV